VDQRRFSLLLPLLIGVCVLGCVTLLADPAFAGPGGAIASGLFRSLPGKILLGVLTIVFLPLILYVMCREALAERRTFADLRHLATQHEEFDWLVLKERVTEAFVRVHAAWRKEQMEVASQWMTDWYWQNQQMAYLDQWERDDLVNHCRVKKINRLRPLFVRYHNPDGALDGSRLVISITAMMEDYLAQRSTGKVVQGKKGFADVETVWTFVFERGRWVVANIEEGNVSLQYATLMNEVASVRQLTHSNGMPGEVKKA
jgi:hypothetical protein